MWLSINTLQLHLHWTILSSKHNNSAWRPALSYFYHSLCWGGLGSQLKLFLHLISSVDTSLLPLLQHPEHGASGPSVLLSAPTASCTDRACSCVSLRTTAGSREVSEKKQHSRCMGSGTNWHNPATAKKATLISVTGTSKPWSAWVYQTLFWFGIHQ